MTFDLLSFAAGLSVALLIFLVASKGLLRTATETPSAPAQRVSCTACHATFPTEAEAVLHARQDHGAGTEEMALAILEAD